MILLDSVIHCDNESMGEGQKKQKNMNHGKFCRQELCLEKEERGWRWGMRSRRKNRRRSRRRGWWKSRRRRKRW